MTTFKLSTALRVLTLALAVAAVSACAPRMASRGNLPTESQLEKIQVGKHTKSYVARLIGTPSAVSTFDDNVWYYIGRRTKKWGFLDERVVKQQIVAIYFDERGVIQHIQRYDENDMREIEMVERKTPTAGHELGVVEQILGNLGRFNRNAPR